MAISSNPPDDNHPLSDETAQDLIKQVARLARAVELHNRSEEKKEEKKEIRSYPTTIQYTDPSISPAPRMPRNLSWHEKVREKKVSIPTATVLSITGYLVIELGQALASGRLHWP